MFGPHQLCLMQEVLHQQPARSCAARIRGDGEGQQLCLAPRSPPNQKSACLGEKKDMCLPQDRLELPRGPGARRGKAGGVQRRKL